MLDINWNQGSLIINDRISYIFKKEDIGEFGKTKQGLLKEYLPYKNGIASDDTLRRRFYRALDSNKFYECFQVWMKRFQIERGKGVIAIVGKTSRRTFDEENKALHVVSVFASEERLVLGQEKASDYRRKIFNEAVLNR